ncbi:MAG: alpha/beta hydrolase family protein [Myxococcota bacterium]
MKHMSILLPLAAIMLSACGGSDTETSGGDPGDASTGGADVSDAGTGDGMPEAGEDVTQPDAPEPKDASADTALPDGGPLDPGVDPAALLAEDEWFCARSQRQVENFTTTTLPDAMLEVQSPANLSAFELSKPKVEGGLVVVQSFRPNEVERGSAYEQAWCKLKTQQAIEEGLSVAPEGPSKQCKHMNEAAVAWALDHVSAPMKAAWDASGITIDFVDDQVFPGGNEWVPAKMVIDRASESTIRVQAMALRMDAAIPVFGQMHYCKTLSPEGAVSLVSDVANGVGIGSDGSEFPVGTEGYVIPPTDTTIHHKGYIEQLEVNGDEVDVYVPLLQQPEALPAAIYMQGAKVDKAYYRNFSKLLAAHGFIVAIANHDTITGTNMTEQSVFNDVWDALKAAPQDVSSPLHGMVDPTQVAVMGHSLGGVAALAILSETCSPPLCLMGYDAPPELTAGVVYGTNTKTPVIGTFQDYDLRDLPTLFVQGSVDGKALLEDGLTTFRDHIQGTPRGFVTIEGANHYGITDVNDPPGADADPNAPTMPHSIANETVARWTAMHLRAHMHADGDAHDYVYGGTGNTEDANVTVELVP